MNLFLRTAIALFLISLLAPASRADDLQRWNKNPGWAQEADPAAGRDSDSERPRKQASERPSRYTPFSTGSNNLSIDVGQIFLFGDLGDQYTDAIGFQLHNVHAVSDMFGLDTALGLSSHSSAAATNDFSMTSLKFGLRTNLAWYDKAIPYVNFGLGFFRPSYDQGNGESLDPLLFGLHLGAGINLEVTRSLFFGALLNFHNMFGTKKRNPATNVLQEVGGSYASFLISAGVSF